MKCLLLKDPCAASAGLVRCRLLGDGGVSKPGLTNEQLHAALSRAEARLAELEGQRDGSERSVVVDSRVYVDLAPNGVFVVDSRGRYLEVNRSACRLTGYTEAELLTMSVADVTAPDEREASLGEFSRLTETGSLSADVL